MTLTSDASQSTNLSFVSRRPLIVYVLLTYFISWGLWFSMITLSLDLASAWGSVINALAIFGPTIAGLLLTAFLFKREGLLQLFDQLSPSRVKLHSYLTVILLPFVIMILAITIGILMGDALPTKLAGGAWIIPLLSEAIRILFFGGSLGEEIGWRGFALPRLLDGTARSEPVSYWV